MHKVFSSSVDPTKLGLTIKSFVPFVIVVLGIFGMSATDIELNEIVDAFITVLMAFVGVLSAAGTFWGLVRKLFVKFGWIQPKQ